MELTSDQKKELELWLKEYTSSPTVENNDEVESYISFDDKKKKAIDILKNMVADFLNGTLSLIDFKEKSEAMSRTFAFWGFKGFSGQMQLNQYVNNVNDDTKEQRLKDAITFPRSLSEAVNKINIFAEYLTELKTKINNPKSIPRVNQSFMLSYFWELQNPEIYPVFFGSMKNVLEKLGYDFKSQETAGNEYEYFAEINYKIRQFFEDLGVNEPHKIWHIEHVGIRVIFR